MKGMKHITPVKSETKVMSRADVLKFGEMLANLHPSKRVGFVDSMYAQVKHGDVKFDSYRAVGEFSELVKKYGFVTQAKKIEDSRFAFISWKALAENAPNEIVELKPIEQRKKLRLGSDILERMDAFRMKHFSTSELETGKPFVLGPRADLRGKSTIRNLSLLHDEMEMRGPERGENRYFFKVPKGTAAKDGFYPAEHKAGALFENARTKRFGQGAGWPAEHDTEILFENIKTDDDPRYILGGFAGRQLELKSTHHEIMEGAQAYLIAEGGEQTAAKTGLPGFIARAAEIARNFGKRQKPGTEAKDSGSEGKPSSAKDHFFNPLE